MAYRKYLPSHVLNRVAKWDIFQAATKVFFREVATLDKSLVKGLLHIPTTDELIKVNEKLKELLQL